MTVLRPSLRHLRRARSRPVALGVALAALVVVGPLPLPLPAARGQTPEAPAPASGEAAAATRPFPAIEAGMHTAMINRIAVDRAGRWAVTASDDKTARIWNLATGKQEAVLRVPVGEEDEGKLYAVALSPDGALVALGGFTAPRGQPQNIYLFDRASGRLLQRLPGLPSSVNHLAFSADDRRLAAALGGDKGIRIFAADGQGRWAQVAEDPNYGDSSYSVEFDASGRLLATSLDGDLRLYAAGQRGSLTPLIRRAAPGGKEPFFARFSPDGRRIAVGFDDSTAVSILDGTSLEPLAGPDTTAFTNGNFYSVVWSVDGHHVLAAGRYSQSDGSFPLVMWPAAGGPPQLLPLGTTNTVMDLRPLADGRLVYGGGDPAWGVLDGQGRRSLFVGPPVLDHRSNAASSDAHAGYKAFRLDPDGRWIEFRAVARSDKGPTSQLVRFDLAERRLLLPGAAAPRGLAPRTSGLPIEGWEDTRSPTFAGQHLQLSPYEISRSLAISPEPSPGSFALGSEWAVRLFSADGRERWRTSTPGVACLVNLTPDGRFLVAALGDGTIRWYRTRAEGTAPAGSEALALFVHADRKRWVLWTPEGFYDASPGSASSQGGASLLGYHLNNGREAPGSFITSAQLQQRFYRPDLVARRLGGRPDDEAAIARAVAEVGDVRTTLTTASLPPEIRLVGSPRRLPSGEIEFSYQLIDKGGGIGDVELRIDGMVLRPRSGLVPAIKGVSSLRYPRISRRKDGKAPKLEAVAYGAGHRGVASQPLAITVPPDWLEERRPGRLHVLAVGISAYAEPSLREGVTYAARDARAFLEAFTSGRAALPVVTAKPLLDGEATAERIKQELQGFSDPARIQPNDVFVLYLAGHGVTDNLGNYVFKTVDDTAQGPGLGGRQLLDLLASIPSTHLVVVLDTCSAGSFRDAFRIDLTVRRLNTMSGRAVLAGSASQGSALEHPSLGGGLFTGVLLSGLGGSANNDGNGEVSVQEVVGFARRELKRISEERFGGEQRAVFHEPDDDFGLTRTGSRR